jgi:hypothetical protein
MADVAYSLWITENLKRHVDAVLECGLVSATESLERRNGEQGEEADDVYYPSPAT